METKTIAAVVLMIAAAGIAAATIGTAAYAVPNGATTTTCVHNGNGGDKCTPGQSSTTVTCTKVKGKFECSSSR